MIQKTRKQWVITLGVLSILALSVYGGYMPYDPNDPVVEPESEDIRLKRLSEKGNADLTRVYPAMLYQIGPACLESSEEKPFVYLVIYKDRHGGLMVGRWTGSKSIIDKMGNGKMEEPTISMEEIVDNVGRSLGKKPQENSPPLNLLNIPMGVELGEATWPWDEGFSSALNKKLIPDKIIQEIDGKIPYREHQSKGYALDHPDANPKEITVVTTLANEKYKEIDMLLNKMTSHMKSKFETKSLKGNPIDIAVQRVTDPKSDVHYIGIDKITFPNGDNLILNYGMFY